MTEAQIVALLQTLIGRIAANAVGASIYLGAGTLGVGKLYEIRCLVLLLRRLKRAGYTVAAHMPKPGVLRFPLAPALANKQKYSYFSAHNGLDSLEAWISVEVSTLSEYLHKQKYGSASSSQSALHEVDVGIFDVLATQKPSFKEVRLAGSCKSNAATKAQVREALGLRRETALLCTPRLCRAPWFAQRVAADPASALIFFSADASCLQFQKPLDQVGVFVRYVPLF